MLGQKHRFLTLLILLSTSLALLSMSGCGKKGLLYLPDDPKHAPKQPKPI